MSDRVPRSLVVADTFAELAPRAGMRVLGPPLAASHPL